MRTSLRILTVLAALALTGAAAWSQDSADAARKRFDKEAGQEGLDKNVRRELDAMLIDAVAMMDSGDHINALAVFDRIAATDPGNDAAFYYAGLCAVGLHKYEEAQANLKRASELDPRNYWYKDMLAVAYSLAGEEDLTIATFEELLKEHPKSNDRYYTLVNLYIRQNQLDKALGALDQIEAVFGKSETVTSTRYEILLRQNKPEEALKTLQAFNEEYSSPRILSQIGDHAIAEYKDSLALSCYEEALGLQSDFIPAILGKAEVYRIRRDYPEFISTLGSFIGDESAYPASKAQYLDLLVRRSDPRFVQSFKPQLDSLVDLMTARHPSDSTVLSTAGMYFFSTERHDKAVELLRTNKDLHPDEVAPAANFVQLLAYIKDWDSLERESGEAFKRFPGETAFLEMQNIALYNKEDYQGILRNCERIIELFPKDTSKTIPALATLGDIHHQIGDEKEAFKAYVKVLRISPDNSQVLNNYAYYLSLRGKKLKKALAMSRRTVEKEPDNPTYLDTIGWILHLMGKDQEAKTHFKHAMLYGGKDSATCLEHYSVVLEALGETDLSKVYKMQSQAKKKEGKE